MQSRQRKGVVHVREYEEKKRCGDLLKSGKKSIRAERKREVGQSKKVLFRKTCLENIGIDVRKERRDRPLIKKRQEETGKYARKCGVRRNHRIENEE